MYTNTYINSRLFPMGRQKQQNDATIFTYSSRLVHILVGMYRNRYNTCDQKGQPIMISLLKYRTLLMAMVLVVNYPQIIHYAYGP